MRDKQIEDMARKIDLPRQIDNIINLYQLSQQLQADLQQEAYIAIMECILDCEAKHCTPLRSIIAGRTTRRLHDVAAAESRHGLTIKDTFVPIDPLPPDTAARNNSILAQVGVGFAPEALIECIRLT